MKRLSKKQHIIYIIVSLLFLAGAIFFIFPKASNLSSFNLGYFGCLCLAIVLVHAIKFFRIYFILLEQMLPLSTVVKIYIKTTLISILFPFKIGELYRVYAYGYKLNDYPKGLYSVIIDKIFDIIILAIILILARCLNLSINAILLVILIAFLIIVFIIYNYFEPTYRYLNRFFIVRGGGHKSVKTLRVLEKSHNIYLDIKKMLTGRLLICMLLSVAAWSIECLAIALFIGSPNLQAIADYISDSFLGANTTATNAYVLGCAALFIIVIAIIYAIQLINLIKRRKK